MSLKQDEQLLVEELRMNGPLLEAQIPVQITNVQGFNAGTLQSLIQQGIATRIHVKGNSGFVALKVLSASMVAGSSSS